MKKILSLLAIVVVFMLVPAQITIGGGTNSNLMPVSTQYSYTYSQQIMPKPGIGAVSAGNITGLVFYLPAGASLANSSNWTVYLGHTTSTSFPSATSWVPMGGLNQVFSGSVSAVNGTVTVNFIAPFAYNNYDHLVIAVDENSAGNEIADLFYNYSGGSNTVLYYRSATVNPNPASPPTGTRGSTKSVVTLLGLTVANAPGCPGVTAPAAGAAGVSANPTFTWSLSQNASGYRISIGTSPGATDVVNNLDLGNVNSYTLSSPLNNGVQYYYTISAYNTAGNSVNCTERNFVTSLTAGTTEVEKGKVSIHPNPFTDVIRIDDFKKVKMIEIFDSSGRTVKTFENPTSELQVSELMSGLYMLKFKYKDGTEGSAKAIKR